MYRYRCRCRYRGSSKQLVEPRKTGPFSIRLRIKRQAKAVAELETPFATWPRRHIALKIVRSTVTSPAKIGM